MPVAIGSIISAVASGSAKYKKFKKATDCRRSKKNT